MKILSSILVAQALADFETFDQKDCPKNGIPCTREYRPVCGTDGVTYGSACMARFYFCHGRENLTGVAHTGICLENDAVDLSEEPEKQETRECDAACTREYAPVCGSDNNTYSNDCLLKLADCQSATEIRKLSNGECQPVDAPVIDAPVDCPSKCKNASLGKKVCGSDGVTYNSICHLKKANCQSPTVEIARLHKGKCKKAVMVNDVEIPEAPEPVSDDCPQFCHRMMRPICGSDYQTYPNECELQRASCDQPERRLAQIYTGPCECPKMCGRDWNPVCGTDNEEYPSPCILKRASCESGGSLKIAKFGPCDKTATLVEPEDVQLKQARCICPRLLAPVCGNDGFTYGNECEATCQGAKITQNCRCDFPVCPDDDFHSFFNNFVEVEEPQEPEEPEEPGIPVNCMKICDRMPAPLCGYSIQEGYKPYSSPCWMEVQSCEAGAPATRANDAVCGRKSNGQTRFYKTGCTALDLGAEVVDESECEEEKEAPEMLMDVAFGAPSPILTNPLGTVPIATGHAVAAPIATHQVGNNKPSKGKGKGKKNKGNGIWNRLPTWGSFNPFARGRRETQN